MDHNTVVSPKKPNDIDLDEVLLRDTENPISYTQPKQVCNEDKYPPNAAQARYAQFFIPMHVLS